MSFGTAFESVRRALDRLSAAGAIELSVDESGAESARLTDAGRVYVSMRETLTPKGRQRAPVSSDPAARHDA